MIFNKMIPELTVFDINQTVSFYKNIGFQIEYERPEDKFVFMSFEDSQFMFEQFHKDGWNVGALNYPLGQGINFSIEASNIDYIYDKLAKQGFNFYRELTVNTYQVNDTNMEQKEFLLQDPNGYLLRFTN